jgi:hypothetical protein
MVYVLAMFSIVVIAVAIAVIGMYVRHDVQMRRKRRAELNERSEAMGGEDPTGSAGGADDKASGGSDENRGGSPPPASGAS